MAARRLGMVAAALALLATSLTEVTAAADEPPVISGRVTTSTGIPLDTVLVEACPPGSAHRFQPVCDGGVRVAASAFNGWYSLTIPTPGDWSLQAVGLFCSAFPLSPATSGVVTGSTTRDLVIDTSAVVEPATTNLAPPFADGADPAGETDASDGDVHLALRDSSRRILVGGLPGGPCMSLHVPYRPLQTLVLKPDGAGPFPLIVMSHGGGEAMPNPGKVAAAQGLVDRGYVVAVPTYPLTARYGAWPGGYLRDIDDQGVDLAYILEELVALPFVDADRIGLTGVSAGGFTSLLTAFHESGFDGSIRGVATDIARPLTAPNELDVPLGVADVPLFMANNVDDQTTLFAPADAFWQAAATPKYRWLEDTPTEIPGQDHGFSTQDSFELLSLFLDAYVLGDPGARCALDAHPDPAGEEFTYEAVPTPIALEGPLATPLVTKRGRSIPISVRSCADHGPLEATISGPSGTFSLRLTYDVADRTYEGLWRTKGLAAGTYTVSVTIVETHSQVVTLR